MQQLYIYAGAAFVTGFVVAWLIRTIALLKAKKSNKNITSLFEVEKSRKDLLQKENVQLHKLNETTKAEFIAKINKLTADNKRIVEDIILLQKSNDETEALLKAGEPEIYNLKIKLIEANNEIARYKSIAPVK